MLRTCSLLLVLPLSLLSSLLSSRLLAEDMPDPRRPAAIQTTGVPVVPPAVVEQMNRYQNVRGAEFLGWSPDRQGMLIRTRFGNAAQLHRVYVPGGRREQITFFEEPVQGTFIPAARDGALLLSMNQGGNEQHQLSLFEPRKFQTTLLTNGKARFGLGPILPDGSKMILSSTERNGKDTDLYVANPRVANEKTMLWETSGEFWGARDWSRDGRTLLLTRFVSANESYPALLDVASKQKIDIPFPVPGKAAWGDMAFSPDGRYVFLATDAGNEFQRLARWEVATGRYQWLTQDIPWDVEELEVDPLGGMVAAVINADGASRLLLFSPAADSRELLRRELKLPLAIVSHLEFSPDGGSLGLTMARPDAPPDAYSLDLTTGEFTRWTYSEAGGLNPEKFVIPSRIQFKSFDERTIPGYYYRPREANPQQKAPVLISIHGGPESQFQPYFSPTIQYYVNEMGLAVIAPNVRGSSGYGKTYLTLDNGRLREDSVKDIGALLDWIAQQPELDASRVAVSGGSYGGYMTLASLVHYGERLKAGIDNVGIANFLTFLEGTAAYRVDLRRVEYGDERDADMRQFLEKISPANHVDKIRSSLLVIHGKNDPRVPVGEALQIAEKVREHEKTVWTVIAENEGHGFSKRENATYSRAVEAMFLQEALRTK
jgi:acetyl esterase/lipase